MRRVESLQDTVARLLTEEPPVETKTASLGDRLREVATKLAHADEPELTFATLYAVKGVLRG